MAAVGNHEMEPTYGPLGYRGATGRLAFPGNGVSTGDRRDDVTYFFDYGNVRFIALDGNDANFEIAGNQGYLGSSQNDWLESVLVDANRPGSGIDFIVVGYHQCNYCTNLLHASDGGTRRWDELFRDYGVDLVVNGHNHSYERAHPFASSLDEPAAMRFPSGTIVTPERWTDLRHRRRWWERTGRAVRLRSRHAVLRHRRGRRPGTGAGVLVGRSAARAIIVPPRRRPRRVGSGDHHDRPGHRGGRRTNRRCVRHRHD